MKAKTVYLLIVVKSLSHVRLFATPGTVAYQAPLSMGFSRQLYWNGLPFPSPGDLSNAGIEPGSPALQADSSCFQLLVFEIAFAFRLNTLYHIFLEFPVLTF